MSVIVKGGSSGVLADVDSNKRLVTGSDLILISITIDVKSFLTSYYSIYN